MTDTFSPLTKCGESLPTARIVDRIPYYRLVPLVIAGTDGALHQAIVPADHAMPGFVKDQALEGWPPRNLIEARGGAALLSIWDPPSAKATTSAVIQQTVTDPDQFLADPTVMAGGESHQLALSPANVQALLHGGRTLVRRVDAPPVLIQFKDRTPTAEHVSHQNGDVAISNLPAVLADRAVTVGGKRVPLSATNIYQLRDQGSTWVGSGDGDNGRVRVVSKSLSQNANAYLPGPGDDYELNIDTGVIIERPLPSFPFVLYLAYEQQWTLKGFARGDLLNSISLTPQEETTIEISSWDRSHQTNEQTDETGWETSLDASWTNRWTHEVVNDVTKDNAFKLTSLGVHVPAGEGMEVGVDLGGEIGSKTTDVNKDICQNLDELTVRGAAKFHGQRQTKVSESREWGFEQKTTRKLRNPNMCRSITYDAFEVLAAYDIATRPLPKRTRLAVLVPNYLSITFDRTAVLAYEGVLRRSLLDATQTAGFDAARWLATRDEYCALCAEPPCCPDMKDDKAETAPPADASTLQGRVNRVIGAGDQLAAAIMTIRDAAPHVAGDYDKGVRGAQLEPAILEYRQWLFRTFGLEWFQPGFWGDCQRFATAWSSAKSPERVEQLLNETASSWLEAVGRISLAVLLYQYAIPVIAVELLAYLGVKTGWYAQYTVRGFDDAGLGALLSTARTEVETWRHGLAQPGATDQTQDDGESRHDEAEDAGAPPDPFPHEQAAVHRVAERMLLVHLEHNRSHYLEAIWGEFNPIDRLSLLQAACDELGPDLEPELLGFVGDKIAVPFRIDKYPGARDRFNILVNTLPDDPPAGAQTVVLPTPGVELQTRLGACDACEPYVTELRQIELAERQAKVTQLQAMAAQAEFERDRLQARLKDDPPQLDDPQTDGSILQVRLMRDDSDPYK